MHVSDACAHGLPHPLYAMPMQRIWHSEKIKQRMRSGSKEFAAIISIVNACATALKQHGSESQQI